MNNLSTTVKLLRKQYNLTQEELSLKSGVGLRFVRDLEQGKETLRLDKVNQLLDFFNYEMVATSKIDMISGRCLCFWESPYWRGALSSSLMFSS